MNEQDIGNGKNTCAVAATVSARVREEDFWIAYRRGINRLQFGKIFGSDEEHASRLSIPSGLKGEEYLDVLARVIGYRSADAGDTVEEAGRKISEILKKQHENECRC